MTGRGTRTGPAVDAAPPRPAPAARVAASRVWPAEVLRVVTFAAVIGVHAVAVANAPTSTGAGAWLVLLHATRESFFVLTAFVLVLRYADGGLSLPAFWRRRLLLIGTPYLVWSVVYVAAGQPWATGSLGDRLVAGALAVATGTASYHLYFLLVSLQFAFLLPLLRRLLHATRGHHGRLTVGSGLLQLALEAGLHSAAGHGGAWASVATWSGVVAPTYQFWFVLGGVLALHLDAVTRWIRGHGGAVAVGVVLAGVLTEGRYGLAVGEGTPAFLAADVFQPVVVLWSVAVVAAIWWLGDAWARRTGGAPTGRAAAFVRAGSDRSFGIFLVHPLLLLAASNVASRALLRDLSPTAATLVLSAIAVVGSVAFVEVARRSPMSLALTGRPRRR